MNCEVIPPPHHYRPLSLYYPTPPPLTGIGKLPGQGNHNFITVLSYDALEEVLRNVKGTRRM